MKKIYQLIIIFFIITSSYIFYKQYFAQNTNRIKYSNNSKTLNLKSESDNVIKNLKYEIQIDNSRQYIITSESSEITNLNNVEVIQMNEVEAMLFDLNKAPLKIYSDKAIFNSSNYNTNFFGNIKISYEDNFMFANKLDFDFQSNQILISEDVKYVGSKSIMKSDIIKIDILTKKIDILMDNKDKNVKITQSK